MRAKLFIFIAIIALFASCEPDTACHQELGALMYITLEADSITTQGDTIYYNQWDSISIFGVGSPGEDIHIYGNNTKSIGLELQAGAQLTMYKILYHGQMDTLYIQHTPKIHFVNMACGCTTYHTISKAWSSDPRVDSVSIINASVETIAQENLRIYLHE